MHLMYTYISWHTLSQIVVSRRYINLYNFPFHCFLRFCNIFCCCSCWSWRSSLPYVHVWWVCTISGVSIWCSLGVIQALITPLSLSRPVLNSSTAWTELLTLLQCDSTTRCPDYSPVAMCTPLRWIMQPTCWMMYENETKNAINLLKSNTRNN